MAPGKVEEAGGVWTVGDVLTVAGVGATLYGRREARRKRGKRGGKERRREHTERTKQRKDRMGELMKEAKDTISSGERVIRSNLVCVRCDD